MSEQQVLLKVENLCQYFKINKAVDNVSFDIKKGEVFGLVGESGCGKTTTGRSIIKLYDITSGNIYFNGKRIAAGTGSYRKAINEARKNGIKAGMIRPITLWPFPEKVLAKAADTCKAFISVELSMGQMIEDVELAIRCSRPVDLCYRTGGVIPSPDEVLEAIRKANK
jgi:ABC-type dipeptide/oligopeptide/nickel transport system ATPase component